MLKPAHLPGSAALSPAARQRRPGGIRCCLVGGLALPLWLSLGTPLFAHGDVHEQIDALTKQIAGTPAAAGLYLQRAALHAGHEDFAAAAADYDRAEALHADPVLLELGRGKMHLAAGRLAEACTALDRVLAQNPGHVDALVSRARAKHRLHDADGAVRDFSAAIAASTRPEPEYFIERAQTLASMQPPRLEEAVRGLDEGLKQLGASVVTLLLEAASLESRAGKVDAALARLDQAMASAARKESWLVRRGDLLARAGRPDEAGAAYTAALAAIAALPDRAKDTAAVVELEQAARKGLETIGGRR